MAKRALLLFLIFLWPTARGASLSGGLSPVDIEQVVEVLGYTGATRLLRSAESYPFWPGIKIGVEVTSGPTRELGNLGLRNGSTPQVNFLPRLYLAKGLFGGLEAIFSTLPIGNFPGMTATGGILKWHFHDERDGWATLAAFGGYTAVSAYRDDYLGSTWEFGLLASKDYVRMRPYLGLGALLATGNVRPALASTATTGATRTTLHVFAGVEWELPLNVGFQVDVIQLTPNFSLFVAQRF